MKSLFLQPSSEPLEMIESVSYAGQPAQNKMYRSGYERYFNGLPALVDSDHLLKEKTSLSIAVMNSLAKELSTATWMKENLPEAGKFNRTILAIEEPIISDEHIKEGSEIIVAKWGDGFSSPIHGHADGLLYEHLVSGTMRVNTYRPVDLINRVARPLKTEIFKAGDTIAANYTPHQKTQRSALIHNFTSIGQSASVHFVPEHTRDGRDNKFSVDFFEESFHFKQSQFLQLSAKDALQELQVGDVALIRSENVPEYGDHFIIITGDPVLKPHGLRPQEIAIQAPSAKWYLDQFNPIMGLTLLKLNGFARNQFLKFHGYSLENGKIVEPTI